jgi:fructokinase
MGGALVVGEALIDSVVDAGRVTRHPGGSPANVALGLARLGVSTRFHTAIGDDADGRLLRAHLDASGVVMTAESLIGRPTSEAIATLAPGGSASYEFALSWEPRPLVDLGSPRAIHVGSIAAVLAPGRSVVSDIARQGRAEGVLITFDPNVRMSLVDDAPESGETLRTLAFMSHVTKLSDEDAAFLFPGVEDERVVDLLIEAGVAVAAVTRGSRGAYLGSGSHRVAVPPVTTAVADTVGAGDSFMAALVWSLVFGPEGWDGRPVSVSRLESIGTTAARAAALTVSRPGADLPTLTELTSVA